MALIEQLDKHTRQASSQDVRDYVTLIRSNPSADGSLQRLAMLALRLGKPAEQIQDDRKALLRVTELRSKIAAGRENAQTMRETTSNLRDHQKQTAQLVSQRGSEEDGLRTQLGGLLAIQNMAQDAVDELNKLRKQFPDVLADEPEAKAADLQ